MKPNFTQAMSLALSQTRSSDLMEATRTIQSALAGIASVPPTGTEEKPQVHLEGPKRARDDATDAEIIEDRPARSSRLRRPLKEVIAALTAAGRNGVRARTQQPEIPAGARYERRQFSCAVGLRDYTVYVPANLPEGPHGLVVMLHGCTQNADDFASGTGMNAVAESRGLIVVYPEQGRTDNAQGCWNWFRTEDQAAGMGEPELLARLAQQATGEFSVPHNRVFVAGLSAGGAMAAILGVTHPDVFRAVGIHSGLAHGSASDVVSAFAAMQGRTVGATRAPTVPTIVFHGAADTTVSPANTRHLTNSAPSELVVEKLNANSRTVSVGRPKDGRTEVWMIDGAGHAWAGGTTRGSYTDPSGPDASAEMARFFMDAHSL